MHLEYQISSAPSQQPSEPQSSDGHPRKISLDKNVEGASGKTSDKAEPKLYSDSPPKDADAPQDVKEHNEQMSKRADRPTEKVKDEDVEKDKVNKGFWSGTYKLFFSKFGRFGLRVYGRSGTREGGRSYWALNVCHGAGRSGVATTVGMRELSVEHSGDDVATISIIRLSSFQPVINIHVLLNRAMPSKPKKKMSAMRSHVS